MGAAQQEAHTLPDEVAEFLKYVYNNSDVDTANYYMKLAARQNWSLRKIAAAVGASPETVRNRIKDIELDHNAAVQDAPALPFYKPAPRDRPRPDRTQERYVIPEDVARRMSALRDLAAQVSRNTALDAPSRTASIELTRLMYIEKENGATYQDIAQATGLMSWAAVKFRLGRYNYVPLPPSMEDELVISARKL